MTYLFFFIAFLTGEIGITYKGYAIQKCWPIGKWFLNDNSLPNSGSFILSILVFIVAFFYIKWYMVFVMLLSGFVSAFVIMQIFKSYTQYLWILLFLATIVLWPLVEKVQ